MNLHIACVFEIKARLKKKSHKAAIYDDKKLETYNEFDCLSLVSSKKVEAG